jgi:TonB-linked SusC/RagA family outer membrane protein
MKKSLLLSLFLVFAMSLQAWAQQGRTVNGKVTDQESGQGLPGVAVMVKGTTVGTATSADGSYTINVPEKGNTLVFKYIGYETQEVAIAGKSAVNVTLGVNSEQLAEVLIQVPYGSVAKTSFTGSEATITSKSIQKQQVTSVTRVLEGLVPGIQTTSGGGAPGSSSSVRIRGIGSVSSSSDPLYVVDGIPFDGSISSISTDDIATVTILKDAAASALYGARAANGVIMITTKRGKKGKPSVAVNLRTGISERAIDEYERVNAQQYYELSWEAMKNTFATTLSPEDAAILASKEIAGADGLVYNPYNIDGDQLIDPATGKLNPNARLLYNDNWSDVLFQQANRTDLNVNISGGAENSDYYMSVGYIDEAGIAKFSGYDRLNARLKLNTSLSDNVRTGINLTGTLSENQGNFAGGTATSNPFFYSRYMGPIYPVWQRDGEGKVLLDPATGEKVLDWGDGSYQGTRPYGPNSNLLGSLELDERSTRRSEAGANAYFEVKFLKDFNFRTTVGGTYENAFGTTYQNSQFGDAANVNGRSTKSDSRELSYTFNQVLTWNKKFGKHSLTALAGHENYSYERRFVSATRTGFPFPGTNELANAATAEDANSFLLDHKIEGYFSQLSYSFDDRYLFSSSIRRDGTSRFFQDVRWGNFYSIGAGWRISQEDFFNVDWVDELKLKGSYGEQGNEGTESFYQWQGLYDLGFNNGPNPGAVMGSLENRELQWEKNTNFNVGFDFKLFNKLDGTIEYFDRTSANLLFEVPLPASIGQPDTRWDNVGTMTNKGWEAQLGYNAVATTDFDWRVDLNLTSYKNEITKLPQDEIVNGTKKLSVGHGVYDFWLREYAGVDPDNGDALYYKDIVDANGDPTGERETTNDITGATYYYHGSALPDLIGGISNSFRFKGFDASILFTFEKGGKFYDGNYARLMSRGDYGTHWSTDILNRWQKPGDITDVPRLQTNVTKQDGASTRWLFDRSYGAVKNINLGYTLSNNLANRFGIGNLRAFVSIDNALLFTANSGMDPQRSFNGTSDYSYPLFRTYTFGLNANF